MPLSIKDWIHIATQRLHTAHASTTPGWCDQTARHEAQALAAAALDLTRAQLIVRANDPLSAAALDRLDAWLARRAAGVPLAYLSGHASFWSLDLAVDQHCLVPRADTEILVDVALDHLPEHGRFLDLGTGTGAIACALGHERPDAWGVAVERSIPAARVAKRNLHKHAPNVHLVIADWCTAFMVRTQTQEGGTATSDNDAGQFFDLVVSNPPYLAASDPHCKGDSLRQEPYGALVSGKDGLDAIRVLVSSVSKHLNDGGWLIVEHGFEQGPAVRALFEQAGFGAVATRQDLAGQPRVSLGQWLVDPDSANPIEQNDRAA